MANKAELADHSRTIPRAIEVSATAALTGVKHGDEWMALYGADGRLQCVFETAREVDLIVPDGDGPVTVDDLKAAKAVSFDVNEDGVTYFIGGDLGAIKIGCTVNLEVRLKDIQACSPIPVRVLALRAGKGRERAYHRLFAAHRLHGEWFDPHPDILAEIDRLNAAA